MSGAPAIEVRDLHRSFGDTKAVDGISFEVQAGEVFGYIGPNGAGKTTSMRIIATLEQAHEGDAFVDGFSATNDPERVRGRLGFMPDYFGTYSDMNCWEYLDFFARSYGLSAGDRRRAMARVLDFTHLEPLADKPIDGLSKGMKQRLCLGRSMIHDPPVLVMDEPAAGLDPRARIELREMIARLGAQGKAILISSHILTELAEMCDRVGIVEHGRLKAVGSVEQIQRGFAGHDVVRIRLLGPCEPLAAWLRDRAEEHGLDSASLDPRGDLVTVIHHGDRGSESRLLRAIVLAGFEVVEFGTEAVSLEEVFLQVTSKS